MTQRLTPFLSLQVRSTTETSGTGTRNAIPVSFPFSSGITFPTALAAPVDAGITFWWAPRPSRHFWDGEKGEMSKVQTWCIFQHYPWFISQNLFANNLHWIVSKMVGENVLKSEHARQHVLPKKHSLCTIQASGGMTLCSNKSLCAHWFDYARLAAVAKFCCGDEIFRKILK